MMLIQKNVFKRPHWVSLEGDDFWTDIHTTENPFFGTDKQLEHYCESLIREAKIQMLALRQIHTWPLSNFECTGKRSRV